jgi:hypothetical protein
VHAAADQRLDLLPRRGADRAHHAAALADQDRFLRLRLGPDPRVDEQQAVFPLVDVVDLDLDRVRELLAGALEHLLADELGQPHVLGHVRVLLGRIHELALGHHADQLADDVADTRARERADRVDLAVQVELGGRLERRDGRLAVEDVDLVDHDDDRHFGVADRGRDEAVAGPHALLAVQDEQRRVGVGQLALHPALHPLGQRIARPLHARQVDQHELPVVARRDSADRPARRLRPVRHDRDLLADDLVEDRRLADVRAAGECDEARPCHRRPAITRSCSSSISPSSVSWSYPHRCSTP